MNKEELAEYGADLVLLVLVWLGLFIFTHGWICSVIKFLLTVVLIYGIRDFLIDYTLFKMGHDEIDH